MTVPINRAGCRGAAAAALLLALVIAGSAQADRRVFAFTYEPKTMPEGGLELEYYMTAVIRHDRIADEYGWSWGHQVELEYGITDHFDVAMYQTFNASSWTGYKLRARYRPFLTGELPVDFMFYVEMIHNSKGQVAFEEKFVIGRTFGKLILSLDSTAEQGPVAGNTGFKLSESLGIGYEFVPWFALGLETQLRMAWEPKEVFTSDDPVLELTGPDLYMGPSLSFAATKVWWDLSVMFKAAGDDDAPEIRARVLWGIHL